MMVEVIVVNFGSNGASGRKCSKSAPDQLPSALHFSCLPLKISSGLFGASSRRLEYLGKYFSSFLRTCQHQAPVCCASKIRLLPQSVRAFARRLDRQFICVI